MFFIYLFLAGELNVEYISQLAVSVYMEHKAGLPIITTKHFYDQFFLIFHSALTFFISLRSSNKDFRL